MAWARVARCEVDARRLLEEVARACRLDVVDGAPDDGSSWIAAERTQPGRPSWAFLAALLGLAILGGLFAATSLDQPEGLQPTEAAARHDGAYGAVSSWLGHDAMRILGILAGAGIVVASGLAARALTHSELAGGYAGGLVAIDPYVLVYGRFALPDIWVAALALAGLAVALVPKPEIHWTIPGILFLGALLEPLMVIWGIGIAAILLLRGHIYGAPRHVGRAALQGIAAPLLGAIIALASGMPVRGLCTPGWWSSLVLARLPGLAPANSVVAMPNPIIWFGGLLVLLGIIGLAITAAATGLRVNRLPGRLQVRIAGRLGRLYGRAWWLLLLAVLSPSPVVMLVLFAVALALGLSALMDDAPWFGFTVAGALALFAVLFLVRLWPFIAGEATALDVNGLGQFMPWTDVRVCP